MIEYQSVCLTLMFLSLLIQKPGGEEMGYFICIHFNMTQSNPQHQSVIYYFCCRWWKIDLNRFSLLPHVPTSSLSEFSIQQQKFPACTLTLLLLLLAPARILLGISSAAATAIFCLVLKTLLPEEERGLSLIDLFNDLPIHSHLGSEALIVFVGSCELLPLVSALLLTTNWHNQGGLYQSNSKLYLKSNFPTPTTHFIIYRSSSKHI